MTKKLLFLLPAALGPTLLLTGAWRGPVPPPAPPAAPLFIAQPVPLKDDLTGAQFLDRAIARLAPLRQGWLHTKVWQKMSDAPVEFEAEGTLDLAPGQCARLDLAVRTAAATGQLLTISDGHALAQVQHFQGEKPQANSHLLPQGAAVEGGNTPERLQFLDEKGCGGPGPLLAGIRRHGRDFRTETGTFRGQPVIHLRGELGDGAVAAPLQTTTPAHHVELYLDARTLWPHRLEWWGLDAKTGARPIVMMEFRAPVFARALPLAECARLFSYAPPARE